MHHTATTKQEASPKTWSHPRPWELKATTSKAPRTAETNEVQELDVHLHRPVAPVANEEEEVAGVAVVEEPHAPSSQGSVVVPPVWTLVTPLLTLQQPTTPGSLVEP